MRSGNGAIDLSHTAWPRRRDERAGAELTADHLTAIWRSRKVASDDCCRRLEEPRRIALVSEQGLQFVSQRRVSVALLL